MYDLLEKSSKSYDGWLYIGDDEVRYVLGQPGLHNLVVVGINPSSATPEKDDPTVRKVRKTAELGSYDGWVIINLYPKRSKNPASMPLTPDRDLMNNNLAVIKRVFKDLPVYRVWGAWGDAIETRDYYLDALQSIMDVSNDQWFYKGHFTKKGNPRHPLYLPYDTEFEWFPVQDYVWSFGEPLIY